MKKILLFTSFIFCRAIVFSQTSPDLKQPSPNIAKTAYLTNLTGKTMQAYPNPAVDQVTIQHVSSPERAVLFLVSMDGRVLKQQTILPNTLETKLNVAMLSKGIYILKFDDTKGDVRVLQLVKN